MNVSSRPNICQVASILLDRAIIVDTPSSPWNDCRYHMAEKSPTVQPTRHLKVLTPARLHTNEEFQNCVDDNGKADVALLLHDVSILLLLHDDLPCPTLAAGFSCRKVLRMASFEHDLIMLEVKRDWLLLYRKDGESPPVACHVSRTYPSNTKR